jgi:AcrR family transcriptional regulator
VANENRPTKLVILEAAAHVFGKKGFNGATTREIAIHAGLAEGTLFRYFPTKLDILYGVVESLAPLVGVETMKSVISKAGDLSIEDALEQIIHNRIDVIGERIDQMRILITETQYNDHLREIYLQHVFKPIQEMLSSFFKEKMDKGELRKMDPSLPANLLLSTVFYICCQHLYENDEGSFFEADKLAELLLLGLKK